MLILSRKKDQKVCFPGLGITVQVLRVKGTSVRLGIDAPLEVRVIRDELQDGATEPTSPPLHVFRLPQNLRHELRNELHSVNLALHLFKQQLDADRGEDAEETFDKLIKMLQRVSSNQMLSREGAPTEETSDLTALLVEDEPNEREMLAGFLRMHGYEVGTASDGVEAMEYLESNIKPSVILMDMWMPRCSGPTTIRRIRENPAFDPIKIIAISGSTPEENCFDLKDHGLDGWFTKPLNPKSLVDTMAVTLRDSQITAV